MGFQRSYDGSKYIRLSTVNDGAHPKVVDVYGTTAFDLSPIASIVKIISHFELSAICQPK